MGGMIRVFVADDHPLVRRGVVQVLQEVSDFLVVGEAEDGRQVLSSPELGGCDVLVLDLSLPKVSGTEVLRRVKELFPGLAVVILSAHPEDPFRWRALADGAAAYVSKERPPAELVAAVRGAAAGQVFPGANKANEGPPHGALSPREHQIFLLLVEGRTVSEVAAELDIHASTVSNHLAKVRSKLGVATVAELVRYAYDAGLVAAGPRS